MIDGERSISDFHNKIVIAFIINSNGVVGEKIFFSLRFEEIAGSNKRSFICKIIRYISNRIEF